MSRSLTKNAAFMTFASVGQKVVSFVYFTIIARSIGVEGTGKYFFALSFTTVFVVFVDLGFTNVLVREGARMREKMQSYLSTVLYMKMFLGVMSYLAVFLIIRLLGYPIETRHLVYLSGVTMLFDSLHLTLYGMLRAIGDLRYEAQSIVMSQFITLILGTVFLTLHLPIIYLILAFTIPSMINVVYVSYILMSKYELSLRPHWDGGVARHLTRIVIPFAVAAIFARVYSYADTIILSKLIGDVAVGWYSIPYKITFAFQFLPLAIVAAAYPRFSEYFVSDKIKLCDLFANTIRYLMIVVIPISVGLMVLSRDVVLALYSTDFIHSIEPLRILLVGLIFSFISFPIGAFLNACDRQKSQTTIVGVVLLTNIILNLLLIPRVGVVGAAISATVGNVLLTIIGMSVSRKIVDIWNTKFITDILVYVIAGTIMGVTVFYVNRFSHFTIAILTGVVVYPFVLFLTGRLSNTQLRELSHIIRKK
jgi:O-antigen/teichoic acid export membrane protein